MGLLFVAVRDNHTSFSDWGCFPLADIEDHRVEHSPPLTVILSQSGRHSGDKFILVNTVSGVDIVSIPGADQKTDRENYQQGSFHVVAGLRDA